jgi:alkaline phosphatase D
MHDDSTLGPGGPRIHRRRLLAGSLAAGVLGLGPGCAPRPGPGPRTSPAIITRDRARPAMPYGVQSGDVSATSAMLWAATDRPARMRVEVATTDRFTDARRIAGPAALGDTAFCAKLMLVDLPPGQDIFYRIAFEDLDQLGTLSEPITGHFRTAPRERRTVRFLWSGDTAGQGWGINPEWGGMRIYRTMRERAPDFFVHCGDQVYADGPIQAEVPLPGGEVWRNLVLEGKHKVAETLDEFRASYRYNLLDEHVRAFNAGVPSFVQWDDHEVLNNWYPTERLDTAAGPYRVESVALLAARARRAFLEWTPMHAPASDPERIHRAFSYGPLLDLFLLDMRSYRGPNTANQQPAPGPDTAFLGEAQLAWLREGLRASQARWKVIASDMPVGLVVGDGPAAFENAANGNGPPLGRELEIAALLRFIAEHRIRNVVWLTADVHYTAAHYYDPARARFTEFSPFWEFVSGPLHAGTFGPAQLDDTFGPQVIFQKAPPPGMANLPPSAGLQFFGEVTIDGATERMTVALKDLTGATLYVAELAPA